MQLVSSPTDRPHNVGPTLECSRQRSLAYPYFVHLPKLLVAEDPHCLRDALKALPGSTDACFTQVRIDPARSDQRGVATQLSRTHGAMQLHTDSSYDIRPHELIAFQMVRADDIGGETVLAPVDEVLACLDAETCAVLKQPLFPFGKIRCAVICGDGNKVRIRYYRRQILPWLDPLKRQSGALLQAMNRLDNALARVGERYRLRLDSGDVLILNNHKVLHGRTALPEGSQRLMYRFRVHLDA